MKKNLVIINNEKCFYKDDELYCENIEIKSLNDGLISKYNLKFLLREAKIKPLYKINKSVTNVSTNLFKFLKNLIKSIYKDNAKYLIISITPYTFISSLILISFRKKIFLYLRSDGEKEINIIFGKVLSKIYKIAENLVSLFSELIVVNRNISSKKKYHLVSPSQLDADWFLEPTSKNIGDKIKLLYIGRFKKEKGIFSLLNIFKNLNGVNKELSLTLIGNGEIPKKNERKIEFKNAIYDKKKLIKQYDDHSIFILPSFTEGHPQVLIESLCRQRPVIVFEDIKHVASNYNGVFVCKRNSQELKKIIQYIDKNYEEILEQIKKNKYPTKENFYLQLDKIFSQGS